LRGPLGLSIGWNNWQKPQEFALIQRYGSIADEEMRKVFNMGIGIIFVVSEEQADDIWHALEVFDRPVHVGSVTKREAQR
jgi:phosphoribosylformylglycinamidine cyclo-ligase